MVDQPERRRSPFTQLELRTMWTYGDDIRTVKACWSPGGAGRAGSWVLADPATGNAQGVVPAGEFSRRFRPVDVFADVTGFPTYLGTVTAPDGSALVDLVLDRNPFMLANGPQRAARPHVLTVPRRHRDGWSSATPAELAACHAGMALIAAWYRSLDGGHVVFCANDSPPNVDYERDVAGAGRNQAGREADAATSRNPRQEVQHAHLHAFYTEGGETENHESSALLGHPVVAVGRLAFSDALSDALGGDAVTIEGGSSTIAADIRAAAEPWGGSYCSYQLGVDGPFWVMPALGASQGEFNRRLARADGLQAEPDPRLGGAVNLARPGLADARRLAAARRATSQHRSSFEAFVAQRGLKARSLPSS